jgi:poly-gamma-glutamate synthase PgsB/CapB
MGAVSLLVAMTLLLVVAGALEHFVHGRNLAKIRIRVHVNGTRGKSSVTRLIAAALRESGVVTCAKTTGTLARMILPDGREVPVFRPTRPNVIEQKRIVAIAADYGAEALVIECMALQPELQVLSELKLVRATHGVITNVRPDHLDVMGPSEKDVALALAGTVPQHGRVYTADARYSDVFAAAAHDRLSELVVVGRDEVARISDEELGRFDYTEHADNVALALRVCIDLGVDRAVALRGMWKVKPDAGALVTHAIDFFGRKLVFYNAFAANDPVSTARIWELSTSRHPDAATRIAIFNCRADRPDRSLQLGETFARWTAADHVVLMGSGTYVFARAALRAGFDPGKLVFVEGARVEEIFERIVALARPSAVIVGMGNIGGLGLPLVQYFKNRTTPEYGS